MRPTDAQTGNEIIQLVVRFNDALNARALDAMMRLVTDDTIFENTYPPPAGTRYEGRQAVRAFWEEFFRSSGNPHVESEEIFVADNRCIMRWVYRWTDASGRRTHIRGVDLYTIRDGLIAEKLSYVKG